MYKLTKKDVMHTLREIIRENPEQYKGDIVAKRELFNDYTDMLCKDGQITQKQYETWTNPF